MDIQTFLANITDRQLLWLLSSCSVCILALLGYLIIRQRKLLQQQFATYLQQQSQSNKTDQHLLKEEFANSLQRHAAQQQLALNNLNTQQYRQLEGITKRLRELNTSTEQRLDNVRNTVDKQLNRLAENNNQRLEDMRRTVDEKLQSTLEKRLGESFKLVSENLAAVQQGLGEMKNLATGVGDLKRVLTNVKTRGAWGEVQLSALLEQLLTVDQYASNVSTVPDSKNHVEFAIKMPGENNKSEAFVWLPIDAKFPQEDYLRLLDAQEAADLLNIKRHRQALIKAIEVAAKDISQKYLAPPHTTDFAILFLPTEGLYAEVLRQPGIVESLQQKHRIVIAGPTTLAALLNSLRVGFRTLALQKRSAEVRHILGAVKTEFEKFGGSLEKLKRQLDTASNTVDQTSARTRQMARKLQDVETLPEQQTKQLFEPQTPNN